LHISCSVRGGVVVAFGLSSSTSLVDTQ